MSEVEYEFQSGGDACDICQALAGTTSSEPISKPHESCRCEVKSTCGNTCDWELAGNEWYGPGGDCLRSWVDVTVTCWDGTERAQTAGPVDFGCGFNPLDDSVLDDWMSELAAFAAAEAEELMDSCPDCNFS
jgi:hypothetical protein